MTIALYALSAACSPRLAGIALIGFGGSATLGMGDPYLFQSIAAVVIGGTYILGGRGHYTGTVAGAIVLTALVSVLLAKNAPDYAPRHRLRRGDPGHPATSTKAGQKEEA